MLVGKFVCDNLRGGFKPKYVLTNAKPRPFLAFASFVRLSFLLALSDSAALSDAPVSVISL